MPTDHTSRFDELLPAYALGALEGEELRELEAHLAAGCPVCAAELRRLAADVEDLAGVAAVLPEELSGRPLDTGEVPEILAGVRQRLLAQVAAEPRLPMAAEPGRRPAAQAPAAAAAPAAAVFGRRRAAQPGARSGRWPLLATASLAAALAIVAFWGLVRQASLGAEIQRLQGERRQLAARTHALERRMAEAQATSERLAGMLSILAGPSVQSVSLAGMGTSHSAVGRTFINTADHKAVFSASNLPALGPDKSYQLWYLDEEDQKTSAGVFNTDARGTAALVIDQPLPLERIQGWVVTVEPRGGRPQPTGSIALAG